MPCPPLLVSRTAEVARTHVPGSSAPQLLPPRGAMMSVSSSRPQTPPSNGGARRVGTRLRCQSLHAAQKNATSLLQRPYLHIATTLTYLHPKSSTEIFFSEAWVHLHFTFSTYFILVTSYFILFHPLTILFSCSQWLAIFDSAQLFLHSRLSAYGDRQCRFLIASVIQLLRKLFTTKRTQFLKHLSSPVQEL